MGRENRIDPDLLSCEFRSQTWSVRKEVSEFLSPFVLISHTEAATGDKDRGAGNLPKEILKCPEYYLAFCPHFPNPLLFRVSLIFRGVTGMRELGILISTVCQPRDLHFRLPGTQEQSKGTETPSLF